MIYTATMWVLPYALQGQGDREDWHMTVMRGHAENPEEFKRLCKVQQGERDLVEFGPVSVKAT